MVGTALVLLAAPAAAQDAQFVRNMCMSEDAEQVALCVGYTAGLAQALMLNNRVENRLGNFCEGDFSPQDGGAVLLEYLDQNPSQHDQDAAATMHQAMLDRFPCP